jgi:hypothetical protein
MFSVPVFYSVLDIYRMLNNLKCAGYLQCARYLRYSVLDTDSVLHVNVVRQNSIAFHGNWTRKKGNTLQKYLRQTWNLSLRLINWRSFCFAEFSADVAKCLQDSLSRV